MMCVSMLFYRERDLHTESLDSPSPLTFQVTRRRGLGAGMDSGIPDSDVVSCPGLGCYIGNGVRTKGMLRLGVNKGRSKKKNGS
ncbi:hypothetical protein EPI10_006223 [Gossypium australe]|uniref:Uncharacterized protein n=1 Tax=Gossypium australe TaxID=47621 RepID=A0A5B6WS45_9ROSI|nr:hypothetical protein EPI10_006223 [Gossypium australe]